jgi:integrase
VSRIEPQYVCPRGHPLVWRYVAWKQCSACRVEAALEEAIGLLFAMEHSIDRDLALAVIKSAARSPTEHYRLLDWLRAHPDGLHSGASDATPVAVRLLGELAGHGVNVVQPRCFECGRVRPLAMNLGGARICHTCARRRRPEECARCRKVHPVCARQPDGSGICRNCSDLDQANWEPCGRCGQVAHAVCVEDGVTVGRCCYVRPVLRCTICGIRRGARDRKAHQQVCTDCATAAQAPCAACGMGAPAPVDGGLAICAPCRKTPPLACSGCGVATIGRNGIGAPQCLDCYERPTSACGRCGRIRPVARFARDGDPDLCSGCWRGPVTTCEGCGRVRPCRGERKGRMLCERCHPVTLQICAHCGRTRKPIANWHEGPVCGRCYAIALAAKATCPRCGTYRRLRHYPGFEDKVCADCAGEPATHVCQGCGVEDFLVERGLCPRCVLCRRLPLFLGDEQLLRRNGLGPLFDALAAARNPATLLAWMRKNGKVVRALSLIAQGEAPLTYETLDALCPILGPRSAPHLEALLTATGVLPGRDPILAVTERWLKQFLSTRPNHAEHAALMSTYIRWQVLKPLRDKSHSTPLTDTTGYAARAKVKMVGDFCDWLATRERSVANCTQADIDLWFVEPPHRVSAMYAFMAWAMSRKAMPHLEVQAPGRASVVAPLDTDERWLVARRLLHDPNIEAVDRVAGALVVIYAQRLGRIAQLRVEDLLVDDNHVRVQLGDTAIEMPAPLCDHFRDLLAQRRPESGKARLLNDSGWVFPGVNPGRPITQGGLGKRLNRHGVRPGHHRLVALYQLAAEMPATIVADLLGIGYETANRWAAVAGRTWAEYPQMRSLPDGAGAGTEGALT